jgi:DNA-binding response OmpR family regulator
MPPAIIIAEDDTDLAQLMGLVLSFEGYDVTLASDGRTALQALDERPHSLVVLDLMMPGMDGFEFRRRQQEHARLAKTPVLVVSARHNAAEIARTLKADGFLAKPFTPEDLVGAVHAILAGGS